MLGKGIKTVQDLSEVYKLYCETLKMTYLRGDKNYIHGLEDLIL